MHRLLLYTLVVLLLGMAWNARKAEVLAAATEKAGGADSLAAAGGSSIRTPGAEPDAAGGYGDAPALEERLEARVAPRPDLWTALVDQEFDGPPAEVVLGEAEQWVEECFPEGGVTSRDAGANTPAGDPNAGDGAADAGLAAAAGALRGAIEVASGLELPPGFEGGILEGLTAGAVRPALDGQATGEGTNGRDPAALDPSVSIASLARLESVDGAGAGDDSTWCGLLDISLADDLPPGIGSARRNRALNALAALGYAESVWLSDERGQLIARVSSLQGLGFTVDPAWPWSPRARRFSWNGSGRLPMEASQLRLVLQGTGVTPSWVGRLIFVPPTGTTHGHR